MGIFDLIIKAISSGAWQVVFPLAVIGLLIVYDKDKKKQLKETNDRNENLINEINDRNKSREDLLVELMENNKKESKERETKLMDHLEKTNEAHTKIANAMERIEMRMEYIEKKLNIV